MKYHQSSVRSHKRWSTVVNVIGYSLIGFMAYQLYGFCVTIYNMIQSLS